MTHARPGAHIAPTYLLLPAIIAGSLDARLVFGSCARSQRTAHQAAIHGQRPAGVSIPAMWLGEIAALPLLLRPIVQAAGRPVDRRDLLLHGRLVEGVAAGRRVEGSPGVPAHRGKLRALKAARESRSDIGRCELEIR